MSAVEIELTRARMTEAELGHAAVRLIVVADAIARAESSAQIGAEAQGMSQSVETVTDDVRRVGRLLGLVAERAQNADDLPAGFYDRWIARLGSAIEATSSPPSLATAAGDPVAEPALASYGPLAGILFVSDPMNPAAGTTTTSPNFSASVTTQSIKRTDDAGFGSNVGQSVPLDSGTHHGRNATRTWWCRL